MLGHNFSSDLKWNCHIDFIIKKAKKRLYSFSQLKCSGPVTAVPVGWYKLLVAELHTHAWAEPHT